jgi:WD40 repeat protein
VSWDIPGWTSLPATTIPADHGWITSPSFSPDGQTLAFINSDRIYLWHALGGKPDVLQDSIGLGVETVVFSPDGRTLVSGTAHGAIIFWDPVTGTARSRLDGSASSGAGLAFLPDRKTLVCGSGDGTVLLWKVTP